MKISGEVSVTVDAVAYEQITIEKPELVSGFPPSVVAMVAARANEHFKSLDRLCQHIGRALVFERAQKIGDDYEITFLIKEAQQYEAGEAA